MKQTGIFIDLKNEEQVKWWNEYASKLVRVVRYDTIVETATNKPVGVLFALEGSLKNEIIKENNCKFVKNGATMVITRES